MLKINENTISNTYCEIKSLSDKPKSVAFSKTCRQHQADINIDKTASTYCKKQSVVCESCARANIDEYLDITTKPDSCEVQLHEIESANALKHTKSSEFKYDNLLSPQNPEDHSLSKIPINSQTSTDISDRDQKDLSPLKNKINNETITNIIILFKSRVENLGKTKTRGVLFYKNIQIFNKKLGEQIVINTNHTGYSRNRNTRLEINVYDITKKDKLGMAKIYIPSIDECIPYILLGELNVKKEYRRHGIGSMMIESIVNIAILNHREGIKIERVESQDTEIRDAKLYVFYRKNNFKITEYDDPYILASGYLNLTQYEKMPIF